MAEENVNIILTPNILTDCINFTLLKNSGFKILDVILEGSLIINQAAKAPAILCENIVCDMSMHVITKYTTHKITNDVEKSIVELLQNNTNVVWKLTHITLVNKVDDTISCTIHNNRVYVTDIVFSDEKKARYDVFRK